LLEVKKDFVSIVLLAFLGLVNGMLNVALFIKLLEYEFGPDVSANN